MPAKIEYTKGQKSPIEKSKLTFSKEIDPAIILDGRVIRRAEFKCECGNLVEYSIQGWRYGQTLSCGCDKIIPDQHPNTTHGMHKHRAYGSWTDMRKRTNPNSVYQKNRKNYVGVKHCARWEKFENFWEDMGDTWFEGAVLARTGDIGDYEPLNCRWATKSENSREARERDMLKTSDGRFASDVAVANGIERLTFTARVNKLGWSVDKACTEPVEKHVRNK